MASLTYLFPLQLVILVLFSTSAYSYRFNPLDLFFQQSSTSNEQCGPKLSIETPSCSVVEKLDGYELRSYPEGQMWAETLVANATYNEATRTGFYRCFYFISGKNSKQEKIEMTGPVLIKPAPEENGYKIAFFVPSRFKSVDDVPTPLDSSVKITVAKAEVHAVLGPFGGFPNDAMYQKKWMVLKEALERDNLKYDENSVTYAGYSSPFQFINRKQEVHVDKWMVLKEALERNNLKYCETIVTNSGYSSPFQFINWKQEIHVDV